MLRKIRITLAAIVFILCAALFLDGSGTVSSWFGWLAKLQFLPALLALNLAVVIVLIVLTLIFGRAYCSVICPLGIMQDGISHISSMRKGKKARFRWSPEVKWLRYSVLALFIIALVAGLTSVSALLAPYSAFGRIATSLVRPALPTAIIAGVTLLVVGILAWIGGRTYCNTLCPVGTVLSFFSRFSLLRPVIDADKCRDCHACEHKCKASCINIDNHKIDYSRCVDCFNCLDSCKFGALKYRTAWNRKACGASGTAQDNAGRRAFISSSVIAATAIALKAQEKKVDGGYAAVTAKKAPERTNPIVPFGAVSLRHFHQHCTGCQLCVSQCPNDVLSPSTSLERLMQPEMSYENGWCRPECTKCSEVCPAGAILEITPEEKTAIHVGTASVDLDLCVVNRDNVNCGNCARHCPAGAIKMVRKNPDDENSLRIPTVLEDRCIGCGACEFLCPSRPYSAIHVNGRIDHVDNR